MDHGGAGDDRQSDGPEQRVEEILVVTNALASAATPAESERECHSGMLGCAHAERNTAFAGFSPPLLVQARNLDGVLAAEDERYELRARTRAELGHGVTDVGAHRLG